MVGRVPRLANFRIYNIACCVDKFIFWTNFDIKVTFFSVAAKCVRHNE